MRTNVVFVLNWNPCFFSALLEKVIGFSELEVHDPQLGKNGPYFWSVGAWDVENFAPHHLPFCREVGRSANPVYNKCWDNASGNPKFGGKFWTIYNSVYWIYLQWEIEKCHLMMLTTMKFLGQTGKTFWRPTDRKGTNTARESTSRLRRSLLKIMASSCGTDCKNNSGMVVISTCPRITNLYIWYIWMLPSTFARMYACKWRILIQSRFHFFRVFVTVLLVWRA